jgi:hypothetical protein
MQFSLSDQETVCALRANWKLAQFLLASFNVQFADYPRGIGEDRRLAVMRPDRGTLADL